MTPKEQGLRKLQELSHGEVKSAVRSLTNHVRKKLGVGTHFDMTLSGAHSAKNLDADPVDFYVSDAISRLYEPEDGWEWKFDKYSLTEQLIRISDSVISKKVAEYKAKSKRDDHPVFDHRDISEIPEISDIQDDDSTEIEELSTKLHGIVMEGCKDDFHLEYYAMRFFDGFDKKSIADEMGLPKDKIEVLHRKLFRRAEGYKQTLLSENN